MKRLSPARSAGCGLAVVAFAMLSASPTIQATTAVRPSSLDELTDRSALVVHGRVHSIESFREDEQIFTRIEIDLYERLKGEHRAERVTLKLYGGEFEGRRTRVLGASCLSGGEETVLFLTPNGPDTFDVVNLAEGKFSVVAEAGVQRVERDLSAIRYLDPTLPGDVPGTLPELAAAVRALVR